ncbi:MAG TPA: response regulator [Pyrinomonadaceae bacterium]|jgi:DNA-binding response OmpR family regulator|nr:response regulator [Pyrinomonadaceae bacterium]
MIEAKKILVAEDDEVTRQLMCMTLERQGFEVVTAEDGIQAYDFALIQRPDLIITDVSMPGADGAHFVRRVRDTAGIAQTPIIVTTGFGTGSATFTLTIGADAYEPKPVDPESLLATVRRLLSEGDASSVERSAGADNF